MLGSYDDYILVPCAFCRAASFQPCVKVRGRNRGQPQPQHHAQRAYAYWACVRRPIREPTYA
jgi:hypothetical protein